MGIRSLETNKYSHIIILVISTPNGRRGQGIAHIFYSSNRYIFICTATRPPCHAGLPGAWSDNAIEAHAERWQN